ncbi:MAG TPA: winged helix-turn-helix transcriptional regulator [Caldimonas sp.]|nr:winged helix-turn-helix transcriptional regulator [Caldimonas sp.]
MRTRAMHGRRHGIRTAELAQLLSVSRQTALMRVKRLMAAGLVRADGAVYRRAA